jgi:hypothetical protein
MKGQGDSDGLLKTRPSRNLTKENPETKNIFWRNSNGTVLLSKKLQKRQHPYGK